MLSAEIAPYRCRGSGKLKNRPKLRKKLLQNIRDKRKKDINNKRPPELSRSLLPNFLPQSGTEGTERYLGGINRIDKFQRGRIRLLYVSGKPDFPIVFP
jgi:hypothetical protein